MRRDVYHLAVIDLGKPWLTGPEVVQVYMRFMRRSRDWRGMEEDLGVLSSLTGNGYDTFLTLWDGQGPTPVHFIKAMEAVRIVYISKLTVPCPHTRIEEPEQMKEVVNDAEKEGNGHASKG